MITILKALFSSSQLFAMALQGMYSTISALFSLFTEFPSVPFRFVLFGQTPQVRVYLRMRSVISKEGHSLCVFALSYGRNVEITNFLLEYSYKNLLGTFSRAFFVASFAYIVAGNPSNCSNNKPFFACVKVEFGRQDPQESPVKCDAELRCSSHSTWRAQCPVEGRRTRRGTGAKWTN